ncbi:RICIN domain-containing protein [Streptomyces sp. NPDC058369]|uniref:RICIN domain-containing protein n=1 Tax=unclassified Streptomyces TaxID=2593676 RepID=UPI0022512257|nr:RICIN domain-containing protein [Streptomyces sp. NBC_01789]MCX4450366.1 RICIN domain-containing protein [Streptomyces sp. NBC_01789]
MKSATCSADGVVPVDLPARLRLVRAPPPGGHRIGPRLRVHNTTGLDRLAYAWGTRSGSPTTALTSLGTQGCLDVPGATTAVHTQVATYACNSGDNQHWKLHA